MKSAKNQPLVSAEIVELALSEDEQKTLDAYNKGTPVPEIRSAIFKNKVSRQATYATLRRAERKKFRLDAKERYSGKPEVCPVDELPLPARVRKALEREGYKRLGNLAGMSMDELAEIPRFGHTFAFTIYSLMQEWGVRKAQSFCPNCGKQFSNRLDEDDKTVRACRDCGFKTEIKVVSAPEPVAATA